MSNPRPSGNGETRGLSDAQEKGTPLPGRTARSNANDAKYPSGNDKPDASAADGSLRPTPKKAT